MMDTEIDLDYLDYEDSSMSREAMLSIIKLCRGIRIDIPFSI